MMKKITLDLKSSPVFSELGQSARRWSVALITAITTAVMSLPAFSAAPEIFTPLPGKPRLANLEIEIWPEYDRSAVLVFLKGKLASGTGQAISLRLPVSSGGPAAVAQSNAAGGKLLNLPYERSDDKNFVTLTIQPPERFFHIEFYDKLDTANQKREYRYLWPGDIAVEQLSVHVQQPATSTGFAITPKFGDSAPGGDTLTYWTKDLGAAPAGKGVPITVRYTKNDARTSMELLGPPPPSAADAQASSKLDFSTPSVTDSTVPDSFDRVAYWTVAILALLAAIAVGFLWRRRGKPVAVAGRAGFCTQCGNAFRAEDRFCSKCGAAVSVGTTG
jgi:hypothetical protein